MPEATFLCIDNSDFMRNGDYSPNRMMAVQEACSLLCEALMQRNPENVIGFLTFGGRACSVRETLTEDIDRVSGSLASIAVGGESHFAYGLQIAMLALSHVKNTRSQKQIAVFVGSPISDNADRLKQLATALRKDDVGVSIISMGCPENTPILQQFTEQVQKNAHLYVVPENGSVIDFLFTTALMGGEGGSGGGVGGGAMMGGQPGTGGGYGREADDSEFAMAIRASLEEEQRRQAAAANNSNNNNAPSSSSNNASRETTNAVPTTTAPVQNDAAPEDDLELALRLSMEEALRAEQQQQQQQQTSSSSSGPQPTSADAAPSSNTTSTNNNNSSNNNQNDMAEFEAAIQDPEVLKMLEEAAKEENNNDSSKKKDGDKK